MCHTSPLLVYGIHSLCILIGLFNALFFFSQGAKRCKRCDCCSFVLCEDIEESNACPTTDDVSVVDDSVSFLSMNADFFDSFPTNSSKDNNKENINQSSLGKRKSPPAPPKPTPGLVSPDLIRTQMGQNPYAKKRKVSSGFVGSTGTNQSLISSYTTSPVKQRTMKPKCVVINPYQPSAKTTNGNPSRFGSNIEFSTYDACMSDIIIHCVVCEKKECNGETCLPKYVCFKCGEKGHQANKCKSVTWLKQCLSGLACFECLQRGRGHSRGDCPLKRRLRRLIMTSGLLKHSTSGEIQNKKTKQLITIYSDQKDDKYKKFIGELYKELPKKN